MSLIDIRHYLPPNSTCSRVKSRSACTHSMLLPLLIMESMTVRFALINIRSIKKILSRWLTGSWEWKESTTLNRSLRRKCWRWMGSDPTRSNSTPMILLSPFGGRSTLRSRLQRLASSRAPKTLSMGSLKFTHTLWMGTHATLVSSLKTRTLNSPWGWPSRMRWCANFIQTTPSIWCSLGLRATQITKGCGSTSWRIRTMPTWTWSSHSHCHFQHLTFLCKRIGISPRAMKSGRSSSSIFSMRRERRKKKCWSSRGDMTSSSWRSISSTQSSMTWKTSFWKQTMSKLPLTSETKWSTCTWRTLSVEDSSMNWWSSGTMV